MSHISGDGYVVPVFGFWRRLWIRLTFWRYYRQDGAWLRQSDGVVFMFRKSAAERREGK